jgi:hypothetical protein
VAESLPSKCEALSSNPRTTQKKKKERKKSVPNKFHILQGLVLAIILLTLLEGLLNATKLFSPYLLNPNNLVR